MSTLDSPQAKPARTVRPPKGYEQHLTRKQAAAVLGFGSEYKVRQLEKEGRLRSVRGPMGTAFYAKADLLTLRSELATAAPMAAEDRTWSDAELLELLSLPLASGRRRTALDLVLETRIPIARAEAVAAFHAHHQVMAPAAPAKQTAPAEPARAAEPPPAPTSKQAAERRKQGMRSREDLIRTLRHPDPAVRERVFKQLKKSP